MSNEKCDHTVGYTLCDKYVSPVCQSEADEMDDEEYENEVQESCSFCPDCGKKL